MNETLAGIALGVHAPRHYLEVLWLGIGQSFPGHDGLAAVAREIESRLGYRPGIAADRPWRMEQIIGWSSSRTLGEMIDREWVMGDQNEFEPLAEALSTCVALGEASSLLICGAGVCRLGGHLAGLSRVRSVRCADLSFLCLYLGRMLIEGRCDLLPEDLRRPRTVLSIDARRRRLRAREEERAFFSAGDGREKLTYEVVDVFGPGRMAEGLVCLPYLLDAFREPQMTTALIRVCESLEPGQRLLLVVTANPRRDPRKVVRTLEGCGLVVDGLRLCELPYSFSRAGFAFVTTTYNTLIAEATKAAETDLRRLTLIPAGGDTAPLPGQRERPLELAPEQWEAVQGSLRFSCLQDAESSLRDVLEEPLAEAVLAHWLASGRCHLVLND